MKKVTYLQLQEKYPLKLVALDSQEKEVVASGKKFGELFQKLRDRNINPKDCVLVGPIQPKGRINVYISLRKETHPGR